MFLVLSNCPGWPGTFTGSWQDGSGQSPGECPLPCQLRSSWQASWNEAPFFTSQVSLFGSRLAGLAPGTRGMSRLSQCTSFECPASCTELALVIYFTHGNVHVSVLISQIIPPSSSPIESKSLFSTSVSLLLSRIQGHGYHLSKFHIYVLIYCTGVFLSDLLHSV